MRNINQLKQESSSCIESKNKLQKMKKQRYVKFFLRDNAVKMSKSHAFDVIKRAHVTEKSSILAQNSYLTFIVDANANKCDIKKACQLIYEEEVSEVKIVVKKQRKRAFKGKVYIRSDVKKAFIKFKNKEVIEKMFGGQQ
ncbi:50S ribosomal protein L23 [Alphaproteobacteria bacterium endosymbiont of Tiliacea citrago]|uniref:50S ribosomal protein L23 n=1 Tax=Alphaproteobacteria bacterium endosymbiont of Tiliacea citrago TaxID=3077944 RepID=UPI00313B39F5